MALAVVGVALDQIPLGHTVVRKHQLVCASVGCPVGADAVCDGGNVARVVMIRADKAQGG